MKEEVEHLGNDTWYSFQLIAAYCLGSYSCCLMCTLTHGRLCWLISLSENNGVFDSSRKTCVVGSRETCVVGTSADGSTLPALLIFRGKTVKSWCFNLKLWNFELITDISVQGHFVFCTAFSSPSSLWKEGQSVAATLCPSFCGSAHYSHEGSFGWVAEWECDHHEW